VEIINLIFIAALVTGYIFYKRMDCYPVAISDIDCIAGTIAYQCYVVTIFRVADRLELHRIG